ARLLLLELVNIIAIKLQLYLIVKTNQVFKVKHNSRVMGHENYL
ncbi:unnamed protein product, partial [marine sediment metagenome]